MGVVNSKWSFKLQCQNTEEKLSSKTRKTQQPLINPKIHNVSRVRVRKRSEIDYVHQERPEVHTVIWRRREKKIRTWQRVCRLRRHLGNTLKRRRGKGGSGRDEYGEGHRMCANRLAKQFRILSTPPNCSFTLSKLVPTCTRLRTPWKRHGLSKQPRNNKHTRLEIT